MKIADILILLGAVLLALGLVLKFLPLGRLPGDIYLKGDGWVVYMPIGTMLVLSLVFTVVVNLLVYLFRRL